MKIKITADSTCDLSPELVEKYNVGIMPLHVSLGKDDYHPTVFHLRFLRKKQNFAQIGMS